MVNSMKSQSDFLFVQCDFRTALDEAGLETDGKSSCQK